MLGNDTIISPTLEHRSLEDQDQSHVTYLGALYFSCLFLSNRMKTLQKKKSSLKISKFHLSYPTPRNKMVSSHIFLFLISATEQKL